MAAAQPEEVSGQAVEDTQGSFAGVAAAAGQAVVLAVEELLVRQASGR